MMKLVFLFRNREFQTYGNRVWRKNLPLFVKDSFFYRFMKTIIFLITVPRPLRSPESLEYSHNFYGGYNFLPLFSITVIELVISNDGREVIQKV